jgi:hypothetical protein
MTKNLSRESIFDLLFIGMIPFNDFGFIHHPGRLREGVLVVASMYSCLCFFLLLLTATKSLSASLLCLEVYIYWHPSSTIAWPVHLGNLVAHTRSAADPRPFTTRD